MRALAIEQPLPGAQLFRQTIPRRRQGGNATTGIGGRGIPFDMDHALGKLPTSQVEQRNAGPQDTDTVRRG